MNHPAIALAWHCWRLSRRWYLLMLGIALAAHFAILTMIPRGMERLPNVHEVLAPGAVMFGMLLAMFTTLIAISLGGRAGFPLRFEFRMPVSSAVLAGVPMLILALLCISLYGIPVLLSQLIFGLSMPLLASAAVIGLTAALFTAASWMVVSTPARSVALLLAVVAGAPLLQWLQPFHLRDDVRRPRLAAPDLIALSGEGYAVVGLVVLALYALTVSGISLQRRGESWGLVSLTRRPGAHIARRSRRRLIDICRDLVQVPCPVTSPWAAELWLEFKRYGIPLLALGAVLALMMPLLPLAGSLSGIAISGLLATAAPIVLLFTAVGMAIVNRRTAGGGYMNPFEGTRGLGTAQMASIQLGSLAGVAAVGIGLMGASLWLSGPQPGDLGMFWTRTVRIINALHDATLLQQISAIVVVLVCLLGSVAFFFCLHSCSLFWGRIVPYGTLVFTIYSAGFLRVLMAGDVNQEFIAKHMWWLSGLLLTLTVLLVARATVLRLLNAGTAALCLLAWIAFLACAHAVFVSQGVHLLTQPPELKAINAAMLTLPVTLGLGTLWCYDRLRHR